MLQWQKNGTRAIVTIIIFMKRWEVSRNLQISFSSTHVRILAFLIISCINIGHDFHEFVELHSPYKFFILKSGVSLTQLLI